VEGFESDSPEKKNKMIMTRTPATSKAKRGSSEDEEEEECSSGQRAHKKARNAHAGDQRSKWDLSCGTPFPVYTLMDWTSMVGDHAHLGRPRFRTS
jgi:hypothetical protein